MSKRSISAIGQDIQGHQGALHQLYAELRERQAELSPLKLGDCVKVKVWRNNVPVDADVQIVSIIFREDNGPSAKPAVIMARVVRKDGTPGKVVRAFYNWRTDADLATVASTD